MHIQLHLLYSHVQKYSIRKATIKTLGRGLHHLALSPLPSCEYCFLRNIIKLITLWHLSTLCPISRHDLHTLIEYHSSFTTEHENARLKKWLYILIDVVVHSLLQFWCYNTLSLFTLYKLFHPSSSSLTSKFRRYLLQWKKNYR